MPKNQSASSPTEKILLTILSLISLGLLVAIIYVWYNALSTSKPVSQPGDFLKTEETETASPSSSTPTATIPLTILTPQNEEILSTPSVVVSGQTQSLAHLSIVGGKEDVVSQADENGDFSEKVTLEEGENTLNVTVFDEEGNQSSQTLNVIYAP